MRCACDGHPCYGPGVMRSQVSIGRECEDQPQEVGELWLGRGPCRDEGTPESPGLKDGSVVGERRWKIFSRR